MENHLIKTLQERFGLQEFRPGQQEIIEHVIEGHNSLVFMPTGGGKSLTYQFPGVVLDGLTIVISPLISLMKDQVDALSERGIGAAFINSTQSVEEQRDILERLSKPYLGISGNHIESMPSQNFPHPNLLLKEKEQAIEKVGTVQDLQPHLLLQEKNGDEESFEEIQRGRSIGKSKGVGKKESIGENIKFLYIAPERLQSGKFLQALSEVKIALVAIDEAHCISQWGHDFRPSYMKIKSFIEDLAASSSPSEEELRGGVSGGGFKGGQVENRNFPIIGLTATATKKVRSDIVDRLGLEKYKTFISGFDRENITIVVREISAKEEKQAKVLEILKKTQGVGIIYCSSRKHVIELHAYLQSKNIKAGIYKGDLTPEVREQQQNAFMNDEYKVMVATNAFGMGIDKKDIRFVIHYNLPGSIENYYQEVGRAGRDGKKSFGIILASYGDRKIQEFFIENTYPSKKEILELYDYLYRDLELGSGSGKIVAQTYKTISQQSQLENDMKVGSSVKILEKYGVLQRGISGDVEDFRGRGITLKQEKRAHSHLMIDWKRQEALKDEAYNKLEQITKLLFYPSCRKRFILEYFGDKEDLEKLGKNCGACDYCLEGQKIDPNEIQKMFSVSSYVVALEVIKKYHEKFGLTLIGKMLVGSKDKKILSWSLDSSEHYGALGEYSLDAINGILEALIKEEYLYKSSGKYPTLGITEVGTAAVYKNKYIKDRLEELNTFVFQKVGKDIKKSSGETANLGTGGKSGETFQETLTLFKEGVKMKEIAKKRELTLQTIEGHIVKLYENGDISLLDIMKLIDFGDAKIIKDVQLEDEIIKDSGLKQLKEKLESLGYSHITYFDIKIALTMIMKGDL